MMEPVSLRKELESCCKSMMSENHGPQKDPYEIGKWSFELHISSLYMRFEAVMEGATNLVVETEKKKHALSRGSSIPVHKFTYYAACNFIYRTDRQKGHLNDSINSQRERRVYLDASHPKFHRTPRGPSTRWRREHHPPNPAPSQPPRPPPVSEKPARQQPGSSRTWTACGECVAPVRNLRIPLATPVWTLLEWRRPLAPRSRGMRTKFYFSGRPNLWEGDAPPSASPPPSAASVTPTTRSPSHPVAAVINSKRRRLAAPADGVCCPPAPALPLGAAEGARGSGSGDGDVGTVNARGLSLSARSVSKHALLGIGRGNLISSGDLWVRDCLRD
jgi:hypothetical protein